MLLEVSIETLNKLKLTAHQFLIVKLLHERLFDTLNSYINLSNSRDNLGDDLSILSSAGFLNYNASDPGDFKIIRLTPLFARVVTEGNFFEELFETFPRKIFRPNGTVDYLRTDRSNAERLYKFITGNNKSKHDHIMKCLRLEIELRQREGNLHYMKRLPNWLTSREWESYADRIVDSTGVLNEERYGTNVE